MNYIYILTIIVDDYPLTMGNKHIIPGGYPIFRWTESPAGTRSAFRSCQGSPCPPPATSQVELGLSSNIHQLSVIGVGKKSQKTGS